MRKVFTTGQIAKICKVAARTVSKWFDSGRLKGYRIPGSQDRRVPRANLIAFLREYGMPQADELEAEEKFGILTVGLDSDLKQRFMTLQEGKVIFTHANSMFNAGASIAGTVPPKVVILDCMLGNSVVANGIQDIRNGDLTDCVVVVLSCEDGAENFSGADLTIKRPFDVSALESQLKLYTEADAA